MQNLHIAIFVKFFLGEESVLLSLSEEQLGLAVVAKFATTATDGKTYTDIEILSCLDYVIFLRMSFS